MIILDRRVLSEGLEMDAPTGVETDAVGMGCITSGRGGTESAGRNGEGFVKAHGDDTTTHLSPHPFLPCYSRLVPQCI